jgi:chemotaxis-related protein WspB
MTSAVRVPGSLVRAYAGPPTRRLFLRFDIGGDRYVLAASDIERVLPLTPLKRLPAAPVWAAGVLLYDGAPVPVIDVRALATGQASIRRASTRIVVAAYRAAPEAPARRLGLVLEDATETVHYDAGDFQPYGLDNRDAPYLGPVRADAGGMVQWVHVEDLLPAPIRERLFQDAEREARAP